MHRNRERGICQATLGVAKVNDQINLQLSNMTHPSPLWAGTSTYASDHMSTEAIFMQIL